MYILYPETLATAKHRTDIMRLVRILYNYSEITGSLFKDMTETGITFLSDKAGKELQKSRFHRIGNRMRNMITGLHIFL